MGANAHVAPIRCELEEIHDMEVGGHGVDSVIMSLQDEGVVLMGADSAEHARMKQCKNCNDYPSLFFARAVYCDEKYDGSEYDPCARDNRTGDSMERTDHASNVGPMLLEQGWSKHPHYWSKAL